MWNLLAFAFTGDEDRFQLWSSALTLIFSAHGFFALFFLYPKKKTLGYFQQIAWASVLVISLLEVIFLVSLLYNANNYEVLRTNYNTMRIAYYHSGKQIIMLFAMGVIGLAAITVDAVCAQRCAIALEDYGNMEKLLKTYSFSMI